MSFKCLVCNESHSKKSVNDKHLKSSKHIKNCEILKLKLDKLKISEILKKYNKKSKTSKAKLIKEIIHEQSSFRVKKVKKIPTNKYNLKSWIHNIHNFLRNSGAGYGMKPLNIFSLFYGLMRLEEYNLFSEFKLDEEYKFSNLVELAKKSLNDEKKLSDLSHKIDSLQNKLYDDYDLKRVLFYELPEHVNTSTYSDLIIKINDIKDIEKSNNVQLSGKVYEYFIGRDESAISALGAFFTDRPIPSLLFNKILKLELDKNNIKSVIDPFGGSGGMIIEFISTINKLHNNINWKDNLDKIYHYDMNEDVVKICGLEIMCLTRSRYNNNKTINSFTYEFENKKYFYVLSNPPYGGDSFDSKLIEEQTVLLTEIKEILKTNDDDTLSKQKIELEKEISYIKDNHKNNIVSINNSSNRIKKYASDNNLDGNCKEIVSMILFMDLLEKNGTACIVMKQGFFFDKSNQYKELRKHLINNFNIEKIIKIQEGAFENTNCVTSLIIFHNNGPTKNIDFCDMIVNENEINKFSKDENGFIILQEKIKDIKDTDYKVIKCMSKSEIEDNENYSLDICDYCNFILTENKDLAININCSDILDINHSNERDVLTDIKYKQFNIGCLEKNKIIKHMENQDNINKENVSKGSIIYINDIIISTCRPNCDKTRLITEDDINSGYITNINKLRVKSEYTEQYPPIYIYAILYQIIGEKKQKNGNRNNAERMFAKSTSYPTIKLEMFKHINLPLHKKSSHIKSWTSKLNKIYDSNMIEFKKLSKTMFQEIVGEFNILSE